MEGFDLNVYWAPGELAHTAPNRHYVYGWVTVPASRKGTQLACMGGHYGILPKGSPDPERGFQIIEYLQTDDAMNIIFNTTGWLGGSQAYNSKVDTSKYPGLDFYVKAAQQATVMWAPLFEPLPDFASTHYYNFQGQVNYHKMTPQQALQHLQQALDNEMKSQYPQGVDKYPIGSKRLCD